jgi:CHAT domain-containing protein
VRQLLAATDSAEIAARGVEPTAEATAAKRSLVVAKRQELAQAAPELATLVSVDAIDTSALRALLPEDETLVEYFYGRDGLYAFVATRDGVSATRLDGGGLAEDVIALRKAIQQPGIGWQEPAKKLYLRLVAPIRGRLGTANLLVVPHGVLHYLPFNALHDGDRFLVQSYAIRLLPAATVLKFLQAAPPERPGTLLALGNPDLGNKDYDLPFAQAEAEAVAKTMLHSRALLRGDASRAAFRKYSSDFQFIHIASHGDFEPEQPLDSSVLLAPEGTDDGRLTVSDLYSMRIGADLVTLSGCETGLGRIANGDDVVGLTRGFLYAGTRTIVASLWQVEDQATGELMIAFYRSLAKGLAKRDALRAAQIEQLRKQPHPFYWAAFQLTGSR